MRVRSAPLSVCRRTGSVLRYLLYEGDDLQAARSAIDTGRALAILRFVDFERTAVTISSIQRLHRARCVSIRHLHEPKSARLPRLAIGDQRNPFDSAVSGEQGTHGFIGRGEGEIADV